MAGCNKSYADNFISSRSSTRLHAPPGGGSSIGSLLFGGAPPRQQQKQMRQEYPQRSEPEYKQHSEAAHDNGPRGGYGQQGPVYQRPASMADMGAMSDAQKVREFTFEAGQPVPEKPQLMDVSEVNFITKMIIDELLELYSTVLPPQRAKWTMNKMLDEAKLIPKMNVSPNKVHEVMAEQGGAFVDIWYHSLQCMAKKGVNLSSIFAVVHNANMAKRDPQTGKFNKRHDGKIIKPKGWQAPDITAEVRRQLQNGSWQ